jgi:hypothetical protein
MGDFLVALGQNTYHKSLGFNLKFIYEANGTAGMQPLVDALSTNTTNLETLRLTDVRDLGDSCETLLACLATQGTLNVLDLKFDFEFERFEQYLELFDEKHYQQYKNLEELSDDDTAPGKRYRTLEIARLVEQNQMREEIVFHERAYKRKVWDAHVAPLLELNFYRNRFPTLRT